MPLFAQQNTLQRITIIINVLYIIINNRLIKKQFVVDYNIIRKYLTRGGCDYQDVRTTHEQNRIPQQTRAIDTLLGQCWASVVDDGPALAQHCVDVSCLLGRVLDNLIATIRGTCYLII